MISDNTLGSAPALTPTARAALAVAAAAREVLEIGRTDLAGQLGQLAIETDPSPPNCHAVMAGVLEAQGRWEAALPHWREAERLAPATPGHRHNLALALMLRGKWLEGAPLYEARIDKPGWTSLAARGSIENVRARVPRPGEDLAGKHVLVFTEQGLGDCVWAARWLPALAARGARVTVATRPALRPLMSRIAPGLELLVPPAEKPDAKISLPAGRFDAFVPVMSLPGLLGVACPGPEAGGAAAPYLTPDQADVAAWRARYRAALPGAERFIGLVWRASPGNVSSPRRSLPAGALAQLASALPDFGFVNLQGGPTQDRDALSAGVQGAFDALAGGEPPLDQFAAAIAATDLLLTVDTLASHLAGAMGHPTHVLVPAVPHFYWGTSGANCPWYPSLRLHRQQQAGDWAGAVAQAAEDVRRQATAGAAP